jgi:hypothetical protein
MIGSVHRSLMQGREPAIRFRHGGGNRLKRERCAEYSKP